ncbi:MAG: response regulator [Thermodesulfobacteriota bacterium]
MLTSKVIPPKILIVDDSKTIRKALAEQLVNRLDATVSEAVNGLMGYDTALADSYDLIITDIDMPEADGFELCTRLKQNPDTRSVPVIMLSSQDSEQCIEKGFGAGAAAYVPKSKACNDLIPCIINILEKFSFVRERLILVVDDSSFVRKTVCTGLSRAGFKVVEAKNGQHALEMLSECKPDLIVTDINMPGLNGMALCRRIRQDPRIDFVPIVIMSTEDDRRIMREAIQQGAAGYIVKPFNIEQLIINIEKLLSDHVQLVLQEKKRLDLERDMLFNSISSLVQALEARDVYTRGHSEVVSKVSEEIGRRMGFLDTDCEKLALAGKLHDIGKIGIRDDVLFKPGRLTQEEFALIQEHPAKGAEILRPVPSMAELIPAVEQHHERMDGAGYPFGLKGDKIHVWARVIAVADVFHALCSKRPYHEPKCLDEVTGIVRSAAGEHLCPECVGCFLRIEREKLLSFFRFEDVYGSY